MNIIDRLFIFAVLPEFLGHTPSWYAEREEALRGSPLGNPFLREKTVTLQRGARASLHQLLRTFDEFGYEKVLMVGRYGEFAHRGGIIDVFPINTERGFRIEFRGNSIETIEELPDASDLHRKDWEKIVRRTITAPLDQIQPGDFLVHLDHGIGKFAETKTLTIEGEKEAYFVIEYAHGDRLFVPESIAQRKLSRYIGFSVPRIHRLGTAAWLVTKRRVREEAKLFAEELLKLYAERANSTRLPFRTHDTSLDSFVASFPHEETPDQVRAWRDILRDLHSSRPMERLLAGDVGFGKTELALRAAVVAALNGYQAALLAPTTVLADQHYRTSIERLTAIGINAALLTRFQKPLEQRKTLRALAQGSLDVLIGTHRILSQDVQFKKLGLLIIDEEQRFGVKQKEALKRFRKAIDILSLTATPIPRTLAQVITDIHPVSRLQTAPSGRRDIQTHFAPWNSNVVRSALLYEHRRGGQSYILHNRVSTIASFARGLRELVPELRFAIAHGQLDDRSLLETMRKLREGAIDVLITTTIIENGLDLSNVNTLIVEDATKLGLAQAYQLRGRIGRSFRQAEAYFLWPGTEPQGKPGRTTSAIPRRGMRTIKSAEVVLPGKAALRLDALREADSLGSGWKLALRDLEIRGAGNLLGREQSGLVNRVGFNLYAQLLAEAVETLRAKKKKRPAF